MGTLSVSASCAPESEQSKFGIHYSGRSIMCLMNNGSFWSFSPVPASVELQSLSEMLKQQGTAACRASVAGQEIFRVCTRKPLLVQSDIKVNNFPIYNRLYLREQKYLMT